MPLTRDHCIAGGKALRPEQRSFSQNRALASAAGRNGGKAAQSKLAEKCRECGVSHRKCVATLRKNNKLGVLFCCSKCTHTFKVKNKWA